MKIRIIIYLAMLAGLILASSCSTRDTIMKRHYMKGYYISKHDRSHTVSPSVAHGNVKAKENVTGNLSVSLEPEKMNEPLLVQRTSNEIYPVMAQHATPGRVTAPVQEKRTIIPQLRMHEMLHPKKPVASNSDGLSLFWIVILVILILWAIGFLAGGFGIGNLINLLLVVALVLLILWLLKII